jgi:hypothetical protein
MMDAVNANLASTLKTPTQPAAQPAAQAPAKTAEKAQQTVQTAAADSVEISLSAQVKSLKQQGQSVPEIAMTLGLDARTVATYLGEDQ